MTVQRIIHVVNRTTKQLEVMDDGVPWVILPGYKKQAKEGSELDENGEPVDFDIVGNSPNGDVLQVPLPYFAAERAKRQNPLMGSEDPLNPNDFVSLIAVPAWGDDYEYLPPTDAIERLDREQMEGDARTKAVVIPGRGRRRKTKRRNRKTGKLEQIDTQRSLVQGEARENLVGMVLKD